MEILFLLGNGFDKNLGMKTSFTEFYDYYLTLDSDNKIIKEFKNTINTSKDNWSDLEIALGEYSMYLNNENDYVTILKDVIINLSNYLKNEQEKYYIPAVNAQIIDNEFYYFPKYLTPANRRSYYANLNEESNANINIITFNYTYTLERLFNNKSRFAIGSHNTKKSGYIHQIKSITHVHGTLDHTMILGVNDSEQIKNEKLQTENVFNAIVKPTMNHNTQTLREEECKELVEKANIVVIYGMSIGETDKYWWEILMKKFIEDPSMIIVVVNYDASIDPRMLHLEKRKFDYYKEKLYSYVPNVTTDIKIATENRILVELNTKMFNFEIANKDKVVVGSI